MPRKPLKDETVRLQKVIAASGLASRRESERLISEGKVTVNGKVVTELGTKVHPRRDAVKVNGKSVKPTKEQIYLKLNKPRGVVTTVSDPEGRETVMALLKGVAAARGEKRVFHVGRLDYSSEGLLLLTNDGDLAHRLSHPSKQVPRTYRARVRGKPRSDLIGRLLDGVELEDGPARVVDAEILEEGDRSTWLELTVVEGRNRLVRRLLEAVGHSVLRLVRVSYGGVELGRLKTGEVRALTADEVLCLKSW